MRKATWTNNAINDLDRVRRFLFAVNPRAAERVFELLRRAPKRVIEHPRLGTPLDEYEDRDVRRLIIGHYELQYEVDGDNIVILRIWHAREERR